MTMENGNTLGGGNLEGGASAAGSRTGEAKSPDGTAHEPQPHVLPKPTYWPAVLALAVCFGLWGVLTSVWLIVVGAAGTVVAAARWYGELRHEKSE
ncbi:MAG: hypothetical protein P8181_03145 [bacterium]